MYSALKVVYEITPRCLNTRALHNHTQCFRTIFKEGLYDLNKWQTANIFVGNISTDYRVGHLDKPLYNCFGYIMDRMYTVSQ